MSPTTSTPSRVQPGAQPCATAVRRQLATAGQAIAATALLLALGGCAQWESRTTNLQRQVHEIGCISECQKVKDRCDDNARFDYRQCEAGYQTAQRDFRWCNSSSEEECGYPWWSCSQNLYGYCTNRFQECARACRQGSSYPPAYPPAYRRGGARY